MLNSILATTGIPCALRQWHVIHTEVLKLDISTKRIHTGGHTDVRHHHTDVRHHGRDFGESPNCRGL